MNPWQQLRLQIRAAAAAAAADDDSSGSGVLHFGCFRWLGTSDSGGVSGPAERELLVAEELPVRHTSLTPERAEQHADHMRRFGRLRVFSGIACAPHPDKVRAGERAQQRTRFASAGEDCIFVHESADANRAVLGAADGVFEWKMRGIDAGEYSRALCGAAQRMCEEADDGDSGGDGGGSTRDAAAAPASAAAATDGSLDAQTQALRGQTVPHLKEMLRERGLAVSGRKAELVDRLVEAAAADARAAAGGEWTDGGAHGTANTALAILEHAAQEVVAQGCQGSCTAIVADVNLRYGLLHGTQMPQPCAASRYPHRHSR